MAYLTVSTGISAGIILNGTPLQSPNGLLGHVGFMKSKRGRGPCGSGRSETFECIASGRAIEARASARGHEGLDCEDVFQSAAKGAVWAQGFINDSSAAIAELCADMAAAFGVEKVVLGGGVGLAPGYLDLVEKFLIDEPELFARQLLWQTWEKIVRFTVRFRSRWTEN